MTPRELEMARFDVRDETATNGPRIAPHTRHSPALERDKGVTRNGGMSCARSYFLRFRCARLMRWDTEAAKVRWP